MNWKEMLKSNVTEAGELKDLMKLSDEQVKKMEQILDMFPMTITKYYLSLIDWSDENDPIRKMCIPRIEEFDMTGTFDTSGEAENTVVPGLQHKYSQTVLMLSTNRCAMYCRHCFRKRLVGITEDETAGNFDEMADYIREHKEISNILISGGDAFMNNNGIIKHYLEVLSEMDHLDLIRFGTRTPVVLPNRIYDDPELLDILETYNKKKQIYVITQYNHPNELTEESKKSIDAMMQRGIVVKNQTVLLRGINDSGEVMGKLLKGLTAWGVIPYYIFQCRPVSGVGTQFQVPLKEGYKIVDAAKQLQNGQGKCIRYAMSHVTGKIEILGELDGKMVFKYHQAKYPKDQARIFTQEVADDQAWLGEIE